MDRRHALLLVTAAGAFSLFAAASCESLPTDGGPTSPPSSVEHPNFGSTTTQAHSPPPISGGTLLIARDGSAVAADPDRDAVYVVDLASRAVTTLALQPGDEPGRLAEDDHGRVYVALRSGGALVTIDLASKAIVDRRPVCVAPRGVAYDPEDASVYVACASGELVELPALGGGATRTIELDRDLRDVVVRGDTLLVSRFRTAEILVVSKKLGTRSESLLPPASLAGATPSVAWRVLPNPAGGMLMIHQRGNGEEQPPVQTTEGGYGQPAEPEPSGDFTCGTSIVEAAVTSWDATGGVQTTAPLAGAVLPVDFALSQELGELAIAAPGDAFMEGRPTILRFDLTGAFNPASCIVPLPAPQPKGQPTAVAYSRSAAGAELVVQTREPAALFLPNSNVSIQLSETSREDTGHDIFHSNAGGDIACASCHPEGGDDGRVWSFDGIGARRTPSLLGTIEGTAPYHWRGEMADFSALARDVFTKRMSGPDLAPDQMGALAFWVDRMPAPVPPQASDSDAVARGKTLFEGAAACAGCHAGPKLTSNATADVGTGGAFQIPSLLGVGYRSSLMHDGCATSLRARFLDPTCNGSTHGSTSGMSDAQIDDLVAYLASL